MKELKQVLKYEVKGTLTNYVDNVVETVNKKEEVDTIDFSKLLVDLEEFCKNNMEEQIVVTFTATAVSE